MRKPITIEVHLDTCVDCGAAVLPRAWDRFDAWGPISKTTRDQRLAAAGIHWEAESSAWHHVACRECEASGKYKRICSLCLATIVSSDIEESIGDPPEYLCRHCFENVPAKTWRDKIKALDKAHQWDWD